MGSIDEKIKTGGLICGAQGLLGDMKLLKEMQDQSGIRKAINSELWHACAGPLVSLPRVGSLVYYFPQGHSEQVAVSTKCAATSQIPNYPNLPSQLMCQVHSVTMHADKDTDEVYAQMSLQPVNSEKDVFPIPDFGLRPSKHPSEFFCKTLTASDTSTHGGFSVPRRAAEKLFPPLDYAMQPPTQELVVHDLHDNTWTFRHIYRGQPKRHLLTTGWSMFISAKRLKAGDAVLFIRDEKSQLLLGVRRANRQQTTLPSSVLSADSMHIGVLAAAAHATANHSPFTIFYNPRACPSEFVIPLPKYRKSVYGTQVSAGVRFGMMFETEESGRRRYMGTVVGISDLDPLRWPGSKWRNLQVEWDEPGCCDRQMRVSTWEIETPESLFIFPSLTSGLKRPLHSGAETEWGKLIKRPFTRAPGNGIGDHPYPSMSSSLCSEQLLNMLLKPQLIKPSLVHSENTSIQGVNHPQSCNGQSDATKPTLPSQSNPPKEMQQLTKSDDQMPAGTTENLKIEPQRDGEKLPAATINQPMALDQNSGPSNLQLSHWFVPPQLESSIHFPRQDEVSQLDCISPNPVLPYVDSDEWTAYAPSSVFGLQEPSIILPGAISPTFPSTNHEMWDHHHFSFNSVANSGGLKDLSNETDQSGTYSCLNYVDPSISSTILDDFGALKDSDFQNHSDCLISNFSSSQDIQSQITSASLTDSRAFSKQDFPDSSGVTSSSNVDFDDSSLLQSSSWKQVPPPLRTYTKVQKAGSVGRSIDVASFKNYEELCSAIEHMFGLEGLLNDPRSSGWKLVYVDYENDVLLVGDDPWEVFVGCVRCIRILSPSEVQQMSEEGMQLLNSAAAAQVQVMNDSI